MRFGAVYPRKVFAFRSEICFCLDEGCFSPFSPLHPPDATEVAGRNESVRCRASRMFCDLLKLHRGSGDFVIWYLFAEEHQLSGISNPKIASVFWKCSFKMSYTTERNRMCGMCMYYMFLYLERNEFLNLVILTHFVFLIWSFHFIVKSFLIKVGIFLKYEIKFK